MSLCCGQYCSMVHLGLHLEGVSAVLRFENTLPLCTAQMIAREIIIQEIPSL